MIRIQTGSADLRRLLSRLECPADNWEDSSGMTGRRAAARLKVELGLERAVSHAEQVELLKHKVATVEGMERAASDRNIANRRALAESIGQAVRTGVTDDGICLDAAARHRAVYSAAFFRTELEKAESAARRLGW